MKRLVSWNVNGIRACVNKGFTEWLEEFQPDILCLQEIKATSNVFPTEILENKNFHTFLAPAKKAGYSGVAIISKEKPVKVEIGLGVDKFDDEGRTIIAHYKDFVVINGYFPNGQRDHNRVPYKLEYYDEILKRFKKLRKTTNVIICGDLNTAHQEIDLANPKANQKTTGFLPEERAYMDKYLSAGMVDIFRELYPNEEGAYTWWTYRNNCRERNIGWRIDYFLTANESMKQVKDCRNLPHVLGSDHCPVELTLK